MKSKFLPKWFFAILMIVALMAFAILAFYAYAPRHILHDSVRINGVTVSITQGRDSFDLEFLSYFTALKVDSNNKKKLFHIGYDDSRHRNDYLVRNGDNVDVFIEGKKFGTFCFSTGKFFHASGSEIPGY